MVYIDMLKDPPPRQGENGKSNRAIARKHCGAIGDRTKSDTVLHERAASRPTLSRFNLHVETDSQGGRL